MNQDHDSYRPRSPDLPIYKSQPPRLPSYDASAQPDFPTPGYIRTHRASFDESPYFSPQTASSSLSYFPPQPQTPHTSLQTYSPQSFAPQPQIFAPYTISQAPPVQQIPTKSFTHPPPGFTGPSQDFFDTSHAMPRKRVSDDEDDEDAYTPQTAGSAGRRKKQKSATPAQLAASRTGPTPSQGIEVKTKFPVARIKRIMQADEDVGKVAQATPTAVSKALELFMINIITKAATEASNRQSKRVTAAHLKQAVLADKGLDFLVEIVEKVPDPTEKKGRPKSEDSEEPEEVGKKKRVGGTRRRKAGADLSE